MPYQNYEEYRLTWTYPYLEQQGKHEVSTGRTRGQARANAGKNEGFYWAGKELKWERRWVSVTTTDWVDVSPIDPVI